MARLLDTAIGVRSELLLRKLAVIVCCLILVTVMPWPLPTAVSVIYLSLFAAFVVYARSHGPIVSRAQYFIAAGLLSAAYTAYNVGCFLFWLHPTLEAKVIAICGLVGGVLYSVSRRKSHLFMTVLDGLNVAIVTFAIGSLISLEVGSVVPLIAVLLALSYFGYTHLLRYRENQLAERQHLDMLRTQKTEAVGRLAGGLAHEFNNILTAVMGNLDLYHEAPDAEKTCLVRDAHASARRAANLTAQLLAYSRKAPHRPEVVALPRQLENFARLSNRLLPDGLSIRLDIDPTLKTRVFVDRAGLNNALLNLVYNARDAMPGGGEIILRLREIGITPDRSRSHPAKLRPGEFAAIEILDVGEGIPEELLDRVGEPFFSTKGPGNHPGLGLPMAVGFAEQSGGGMVIEPVPKGGTMVCLLLPVSEKTLVPDAPLPEVADFA